MANALNKASVLTSIIAAIHAEFNTLRQTSRKTRAAGNDAESKAEGKYDTRSTEDNYLADGLARQAQAAAAAGNAFKNFTPKVFEPDTAIDIGALVQLEFAEGELWFFLAPAGGGIEVTCAGIPITVLTPESPLGKQLIGMKAGDAISSPQATVRSVQ